MIISLSRAESGRINGFFYIEKDISVFKEEITLY